MLVPDYSHVVEIYRKDRYVNSKNRTYIYNNGESGNGEKVLSRPHQWLQYWATDSNTNNWSRYYDYSGAASYTIPQDGYINFTYAMTSYYTTEVNPWVGYDSSKTASFAAWLKRDGNIVEIYSHSGLAGEFMDEQLTPVAQGDIIYYGVLNKGNQLPATAIIKFYPAKLKRLS